MQNKSTLASNCTAVSYLYLKLSGGAYTVLNKGEVSSLFEIPEYNFNVTNLKESVTIRLEIECINSDGQYYISDDQNIILTKPGIFSESNVVCENGPLKISISPCTIIDKSPYTYSLVYNDSNLNNYGTPINGTSMWMTNSSAQFIGPSFVNYYSKIDKIINIKALVKDVDGNVQESENVNFKELFIQAPGLPAFKFLCDIHPQITLDLNGVNENFIGYNWFYRDEVNHVDSLLTDTTKTVSLSYEGSYFVVIYKIDSLSGSYCHAISANMRTYNTNIDPTINADRFQLTGPLDSVRLYTVFPFSNEILDMIKIQWFKDNDLIIGANSLDYYAKESGLYSAIIYDLCNEFTNSNYVTVEQNIKSTAVKDNLNKSENYIKIYPNPSNGIFTLALLNETLLNRKANIEVTDNLGKLVLTKEIYLQNEILLDIKDKSNGVYLVKINLLNSDLKFSFKYIKSN